MCQAKIAAAELWRAYSEHYRSHQARHPVTNVSRHHQHLQQQQQQQQVKLRSDGGPDGDSAAVELRSQNQHGGTEKETDSPDRSVLGLDGDSDSGQREDGDVFGTRTNCELAAEGVSVASSNSNDDNSIEEDFDVEAMELGSVGGVWNDHEDSRDSPSKNLSSPSTGAPPAAAQISMTDDDVDCLSQMTPNDSSLRVCVQPESEVTVSVLPGFDDASVGSSTVNQLCGAGFSKDVGPSSTFPQSTASAPPLKVPKKSPGERQSSADYRRSERGLSYLFPSFSDHGMSLLDKVRITVARHKNNYFLGWTADQLSRLDPVVRPKVPVTPAVYREYCHRNAMKYDSNLQFACESPEPWAAEFRTRLTLPPADGGFSSLCEVKLEAGRLWREHSGRYRMHNIVKWQMGMNSAVLANGSAATAVAAVKPTRTRGKSSPSTKALDRHHPSSSASALSQNRHPDAAGFTSAALSMTVPSSLTLHLSPYVITTPGLTAPPFTAVAPATPSAALGLSTSSCGDVLDMSVSSASCSVTADSAGPLFEPLPSDMPAASQLRVWLERHRSGYFVNASPPPSTRSDAAVDYVRPRRWPVTPSVLNAEIPPGVVEVLGKIDRLLSLPVDELPSTARRFRDRLNAPDRSDDAFATFEEAVTDALSAWSAAVSQIGFGADGVVAGGSSSPHRKRKRGRTASVAPHADAVARTSDVPASSNGGDSYRYVISDDDDDDDDSGGLVVALPSPSSASPSQPQSPSSVLLSVDVVQQLLWSSRSLLHDACVQNSQLGWNERLEPLQPILTSNLGHDYVTPSQGHAATVDLVLSMLHSRLDDLASTQSRLDNNRHVENEDAADLA